LTESELVTGCRSGDREAQHELYARTSQRIHRLLLRMTRDPEAAFDLAQDTYLRAFARIEQFDGRSSLATWLYRIAVTEALQFLRRDRRIRSKLREGLPEGVAESAGDRVAARLDVNDALAAIDPTDRLMLLLRYQEGLDYRTIAEVTDCAPGTVASRLNRARQRLRSLLESGYASGEEASPPEHPKEGG